MKIAIIGQGYVGLPLSIAAAKAGNFVVGFDIDKNKIDLLSEGRSYIEDVSDDDLKTVLGSNCFFPTADQSELNHFDFAIITVPTPLKDSLPDLSSVTEATIMIGNYLTKGSTVVLESTTYPGTTSDIVVPLLERQSRLSAGTDFFVGFSPERIDPGNKMFNFKNTTKIVSGINEESLHRINSFYSSIVDKTYQVNSPDEAELAKLIENTFRHVNIALMNELSIYSNLLGINLWEAIEAAKTKPFGFMPFYPGPGVGGHCLPIDPSYLSYQVKLKVGETFKFVELANEVNKNMPSYVVRRVTLALNKRKKSVNGSNILAIGISYKPDTSDIRESPAIDILRQLRELGADIRVIDPLVQASLSMDEFGFVDLNADIVSDSDMVLILSPHKIIDLELIKDNASHVFDLRHVIQGENVEYL